MDRSRTPAPGGPAPKPRPSHRPRVANTSAISHVSSKQRRRQHDPPSLQPETDVYVRSPAANAQHRSNTRSDRGHKSSGAVTRPPHRGVTGSKIRKSGDIGATVDREDGAVRGSRAREGRSSQKSKPRVAVANNASSWLQEESSSGARPLPTAYTRNDLGHTGL